MYAPVTDRIFLGGCPFPHVVVETLEEATTAFEAGETILVPSEEIALSLLLYRGLDPDMAQLRVDWASARVKL